jgi:hypothetical protein
MTILKTLINGQLFEIHAEDDMLLDLQPGRLTVTHIQAPPAPQGGRRPFLVPRPVTISGPSAIRNADMPKAS